MTQLDELGSCDSDHTHQVGWVKNHCLAAVASIMDKRSYFVAYLPHALTTIPTITAMAEDFKLLASDHTLLFQITARTNNFDIVPRHWLEMFSESVKHALLPYIERHSNFQINKFRIIATHDDGGLLIFVHHSGLINRVTLPDHPRRTTSTHLYHT